MLQEAREHEQKTEDEAAWATLPQQERQQQESEQSRRGASRHLITLASHECSSLLAVLKITS